MCGRYSLEGDFSDFPKFEIPKAFIANADLRPTDPGIVLRDENGAWVPEIRRWGFHREWPGPTGKWQKRALFNAKGEELESKRTWRQAYASSRCLVLMNAWYEWPVIDGKKVRTRISLRKQRCFAVAGLFEDADQQSAFTIVTVPPNDYLGTAHDRAPLVLQPSDYEAWLDGGVSAAALICAHPDNEAFAMEAVPAM